ncbi:HpcH/HpaI aldolase/citrate lyase family protein [Corynebacterium epidermidicanis]|uniref:Citrate lyase beta subunit n=1 Tax=Corynebacterium epidermidicanis TaxID=1050174 RepID=A0A0G3GV01_9CORY|nr:CoA ester lyase [Corynebacterium epidermidicanis]AKK02652.1 citrate lyase beta subunit [Corynebacterium epidermidicanis]
MNFDHLIPGPAILFAPAGRADIIPKAAAKADMVILDLEDGAGDVDRDIAYANIRDSALPADTTIVRVAGPNSPHFSDDVAFVRTTPYRLVMVPKVESDIPGELAGLQLIAMVETPQAVVNLPALAAHPDVVGMFWGAEDLTVLLGGTHSRLLIDEGAPSTRPGPYRAAMATTRALMHIHAAAHGKFVIDAVHADFRDEEGLFLEAADAARSGFIGFACIHPLQVDVVRRAFAPDVDQLEWARRVVAEASHHPGAFKLDGEMIDAPLISQARRVVARGDL